MIELVRVSYPMRIPISTAHGPITERHALLVGVTEDDTTGWTEVNPLPGFGLETDLDLVEAAIRSHDDHPALEAAQLDLAARKAGVSLAEHLAGAAIDPVVEVNATVGDLEPDATAKCCGELVADGFRAVKLKVAVGSIDRDVERVAAARQAVGPDVELRLDANQGWTYEQASAAIERLAEFDIAYLEEPTANSTDLARLASVGIALAVDETLTSLDRGLAVIADPFVNVVVLKPAVLGGGGPTLKLAREAIDAGKRVIVTSFFDGPIGLATATAVAAASGEPGPHGLGTASAVVAEFPSALVASEGHIHVAPGPGIGVTP